MFGRPKHSKHLRQRAVCGASLHDIYPRKSFATLNKMPGRNDSAGGAGLFDGSPSPKRGAPAGGDGERRTKLRRYATVAAQALNPYGVSSVEHASCADLWGVCTEGHKAAHFLTELAATDATGGDMRAGIGISKTAQVLVAAIETLKLDVNKKWIAEEPYAKAIAEADELLPHLNVLNCGTSGIGERRSKGFASMGGGRNDRAPASDAAATGAAAAALHKWLAKDRTPLRGMLGLLSGGGVFYAAAVAEKTARAWLHCKPASEEQAVRAAQARHAGAAGARAASGSSAGANEDFAAGLD